jgi:PAS domain S-box-containing protein
VVAGYEDTYSKVLVSITNITEQKLAEAALRESEQRLRTVLENMPVLLFADAGDYITVLWNKECERVTGYKAEEVIGRQDGVDILYPDPDYRAYMLDYYNQHQGYYRNWETEATTKDGQRRVINWSNISPRFPVPGWTNWGVGIDITERKRAEERIALMQQVTTTLAATLTVNEVAAVMVNQAFGILEVHIGAISIISDDGQYLDIIGQTGVTTDVLESYQHIPLDMPTPMSDAVRNGQTVWIQSLEEYAARYPDIPKTIHQQTGTQAVACLPLVVNGRVIGGMGMSFRQPQPFTPENQTFIQALADQCAQALERARLYQAEQSAREAAEARAARITRLQAVTAALSQGLSTDEIARVVVQEGMVALKASAGAVNLLADDDTFEVVYTTSYRLEASEREGWQRFPADPTFPVTDAVRTRQALWLETAEERNARYPAVASLSETYPGAWAIVPLLVGEVAIGAVNWAFDKNRTLSEEERAFMMALAQQCAQALERARLIEQEKHRAVLEERQRIARDLHDAVSQTLFAANVMAQSLPRLWERQPKTIPGRLDELARLTQGAASEMRVLLLELRPIVLLESKLTDLLSQLVQIARGRSRKIAITTTFEGDYTLPPDVHLTFYRVAQETLNNINKHSGASQVAVHFTAEEGRAELRISDNGKGFSVSDAASGFGLEMMRERAQEINATLNMTSQVGQGTEVVLAWEAERSPEAIS